MIYPPINDTLQYREYLMYGHNYEVAFGVRVFENCSSLEGIKENIQVAFPEALPDRVSFMPFSAADLQESIKEYLSYRGDHIAGLTLTPAQEKALTIQQINQPVWLCDVTLFVFGTFPETIYVAMASRSDPVLLTDIYIY